MKKIFSCCMIAMLLGISSSQAQTDEKALAKEIENQTKSMTKAYSLSAEQTEAVKQLNELRAKQIADIDAALPADANAQQKGEAKKMKAEIQTAYDSMLKDLLSEKQYAKYQEDEAEKKEKIQGNVNWVFNMAARRLGSSNVNLLGWNGNISDSMKIATEATDRLVRKYKLDDEQKEKVLALNIAEISAEIAERRNVKLDDNTGLEISEKVEEFVALAKKRSANYERYLKEILNEEQYKKYTNAKKAQETRRNAHFGSGGWGGPPPRW